MTDIDKIILSIKKTEWALFADEAKLGLARGLAKKLVVCDATFDTSFLCCPKEFRHLLHDESIKKIFKCWKDKAHANRVYNIIICI